MKITYRHCVKKGFTWIWKAFFFFTNKVDSGQTLVLQVQARDILSRGSVRKWDGHLIGHMPHKSWRPILTFWYACTVYHFDELIQFQSAVKSNSGVQSLYIYCCTFPSAKGLILHLNGFIGVSCAMHHIFNAQYQCSIYTLFCNRVREHI